ncbi:MAG: amidohydrolase family protein [Promethearchaeota archaeon]
MTRLEIKNGLVFDPMNNINGEIKDILIENGKIVEKFSSETDVKILNAKGKTVIPSAVEIHCHVAAQQTNWARLLGSKHQQFMTYWQGLTLQKIAHDYIKHGYTFILEANVFPSLAKHALFNFQNIPVLDKAFLLNVSNLWALELEYQKGKIEEMAAFLSNLLKRTHGFGLKAYNPFENENWNYNYLREDLLKPGRLYNFCPMDVYLNLLQANERLNLPHSLHVHVEGYETPKGRENLNVLIDNVESLALEGKKDGTNRFNRNQLLHLAHGSLYNVDGDNSNLIDTLNKSQDIDLDLGMVGFDEINPLITSDRRLINLIEKENQVPVIKSAVEDEGDQFCALRILSKTSELHSIFLMNALDLALNIQNKWQIQFSLNYPNHGDVNDIPTLIGLLMSAEKRKKFFETLHPIINEEKFRNTREKKLNFNEIIILTRASPARSLGIGKIKGNLGVGADGDVNILDIDINELNLPKDIDILEKVLSNVHQVIKAGIIVKEQDNFNLSHHGNIFHAHGDTKEFKDPELLMKAKKDHYKKFSSIFYESLSCTVNQKLLREIG